MPLPVSHALFLDPWLEPFENSDLVQAGKSAQARKVILHSEGFTLWTTHMAQVVELAKDWGEVPIYTIGAVHSPTAPWICILTLEIHSPVDTPGLLRLYRDPAQVPH